MEGDPFVAAIRVGLAVLLALGPGLYPALQLLGVLQPAHSRTQRLLLLPPLSLLIAFTTAGWLVILLGFHSVALWVATMAFVNAVVYLQRRRKHETLLSESPWERLERLIDSGEIADHRAFQADDSTDSEAVDLLLSSDREEHDDSAEQALRDRLSTFLDRLPDERMLIAVIALFIALGIPLFSQPEPLGIDWVGFSTLTHRFAIVGDATLPPPSVGRWTYPPAFPALAAYLESTLQISPQFAVHILGQLSLFCVIIGAAGAMERFGAGLQTILAVALAAGLFVKTFDSGYPTVASQLGLTVGLLVLVGQDRRRNPKRDMTLAITVGAVGAIHPTGSVYLAALLLAHVAAHLIEPGEDARRGGGMVAGTSIILGMAMVVVLGIFAPRLLERAVQAEYGWQGGLPLLLWNSPLLLLALAAAWRLRHTMEGRILSIWLLLQWLISAVHLFDGLIGIGAFTLFSYVLYSMALHGFHIPLACVTALALAPTPRLTACAHRRGLTEEAEIAAVARMTARSEFDDESDGEHSGSESQVVDSTDRGGEDSAEADAHDAAETAPDESEDEEGSSEAEGDASQQEGRPSEEGEAAAAANEQASDEDGAAVDSTRSDDQFDETTSLVTDSLRFEQVLWPLPRPPPEHLTNILFAFVAVISLLGAAWVATLGEHPELQVRTLGDRSILQEVDLPAGSVVLVENNPWGVLIEADAELGVTAFPRLGLIDIDETFGWNLSSVVANDDATAIAWYGITHAITSPRGETGTQLAASDHWELLLDLDGSRLWRFAETPTSASTKNSLFLFADETDCGAGCEMRTEAWWGVDEWRIGTTPEQRPYLSDGIIEHDFEPNRQIRDRWLRCSVLIEGSAGQQVSLSAGTPGSMARTTVLSGGQMEQLSVLVHAPVNGSMQISVQVDGQPERWLNPMAVSGRGDRLIDGGGLWVHWMEVRPA